MIDFLSVLLANAKLIFLRLRFFRRLHIKFPQKLSFNFKFKIKSHAKVKIGKLVRARNYLNIECYENSYLEIGENTFFNNFNTIICRKRVKIGSNCLFAENVKIYDHNHIFNQSGLIRNLGFKKKEVTIGDNVRIGSNVVVLGGAVIGNNCVIGANCVIDFSVPDNTVVTNERVYKLSKIKYKGDKNE